MLNYITGLYNSIPSMTYFQQVEKRWAPGEVMGHADRGTGVYGSRPIYGKTFGFLGYGSVSGSWGAADASSVASLPAYAPSFPRQGSLRRTRAARGMKTIPWVWCGAGLTLVYL